MKYYYHSLINSKLFNSALNLIKNPLHNVIFFLTEEQHRIISQVAALLSGLHGPFLDSLLRNHIVFLSAKPKFIRLGIGNELRHTFSRLKPMRADISDQSALWRLDCHGMQLLYAT